MPRPLSVPSLRCPGAMHGTERVPQTHWTRSKKFCIVGGMLVGGQEFTPEILALVQEVATSDGMTRQGLSRLVCKWLDWRHPDGRLKEMNCRKALLTLNRRGLVGLPEAKPTDFSPREHFEKASWPVISCSLSDLGQLELVLVDGGNKELSRTWRQMMKEHHPLGDGPLCGAQLRYLVRSSSGWLGGLSFSGSAWRLNVRDDWIGWDDTQRSQGLQKIVCNSRFLIMPTVVVPGLASHVLGLALRRLRADWFTRYGYKPVLVETFIDTSHWKGTCYRAANFIDIGETKGRGRQDRTNEARLSRKKVLIYELAPDWRNELCLNSNAECPLALDSIEPVIDWADQEFGRSSLGDSRLTERLKTLARDFCANPTANLPQACGSRAKIKAAYRFLDNETVSLDKILESHFWATEARAREKPVALAVQDTTTLNYTTPKIREGLGPIEFRSEGGQGLILHSTLAFDTDGVPLGFIDAQSWARDADEFGKVHRKRREKLPIEAKESFKWLKSYRAVAELQRRNPNVTFVSVGDRESDIYELFAEAVHTNPSGPKLLVRAQHNRQLRDEELRLWETLERQPLAGTHVIKIPRRGSKPARNASLELRYCKVTLSVPVDKQRAKGGKSLSPVEIWALLAEEKDNGSKDRLQWLLLTTLPINSFEEASEKLRWYTKRWGIEVFHRTLKSGCRIENRQLRTADRLEACLAIDMVVAWRVHNLTHLARELPEASCEIAFEENEWQSLVAYTQKRTPLDPPNLRDAVRLVASLGGFIGRKCDGEPGTQTIWLGLDTLGSVAAVFELLRQNPKLLDVPQRRVSRRSRFG